MRMAFQTAQADVTMMRIRRGSDESIMQSDRPGMGPSLMDATVCSAHCHR
jgi:hypothetical protein